MFGVSGGSRDNGVPKAKLARKPSVVIKDGDGTSDPEKVIGTITTPTTHGGGASQKYMAVVKDPSGTFQWTCSGNATIANGSTDALVEVQGSAVSGAVDDTTLTVSYTLNGVVQTASAKITVVSVEIEVATNAPNDSIVQLRSIHPPHQPTVGGTIRLMGPQARVVITNPDGRLGFPDQAATLLDFELVGNQDSKNFDISGQQVSVAVGDAVMEARAGSANGPLLATKTVTVFSFDPASLLLTQGQDYSIADDPQADVGGMVQRYMPDGVAVTFSAQAAITPTGLDCSADQIANLRITFMQQVEAGGEVITTYSTPQVLWDPLVVAAATATGTSVTGEAPAFVRVTAGFDPSVTLPIRDGEGGTPLYSRKPEAATPPSNCAGGDIATATDAPSHQVHTGALNGTLVVTGGIAVVGKVRYTFINTSRVQRFRTFLVVWIQGTEEVTAVREALWEINLDSAMTGQRAVVQADGPSTVDPAMGPPANDAKHFSNTEWLGLVTFEL